MAMGKGSPSGGIVRASGVSASKNATNSNKVESPITSINKQIRQMSNDVTAKTFAFNHEEADIARDWQSYMSNTSHQREVEDLKKAGLNPVLSANGGASAYSASSASGSADNSAVSMLASLYNTKMNNDNAVKIANINQQTQRETNKNQKEIANINAAVEKYKANSSYSASRYASDNSYAAALGASYNNYAASVYGSNKSYESSIYASDHTKYAYIDSFVKELLGSGDNTSTSTLGKIARSFIKKYKK